MSITLAPTSAKIVSSFASPPGRSLTLTNTMSRRPACVSNRRMSPGTTPRSTFPPDRTTHVVPLREGAARSLNKADTPTAPPPSTYNFERSINSTMASATASSSTTTMSSSHFSISGRVISPGFFTAIPSANVNTGPDGGALFAYGAHAST